MDKSNSYTDRLLQRYYEAETTLREESELRKILADENLEPKYYADRDMILGIRPSLSVPEDLELSVSRIVDNLSAKERRRKFLLYASISSAAAVIAVIMLIGYNKIVGNITDENVNIEKKIAENKKTEIPKVIVVEKEVKETYSAKVAKTYFKKNENAKNETREFKNSFDESVLEIEVKDIDDFLTEDELLAYEQIETAFTKLSTILDKCKSNLNYYSDEQ